MSTTNLPAVIAELKTACAVLADASTPYPAWGDALHARRRLLEDNASTLIAAAEECAVLRDEKANLVEQNGAVILRAATAEKENERLREALDKIRQAEPCTHEGSCFYPRHDGDGNFISDDHVDPLSVIQDMVGIARAALEGKT